MTIGSTTRHVGHTSLCLKLIPIQPAQKTCPHPVAAKRCPPMRASWQMTQTFSSSTAADLGRSAASARDIRCISRADMLGSTDTGRAAGRVAGACGGGLTRIAVRIPSATAARCAPVIYAAARSSSWRAASRASTSAKYAAAASRAASRASWDGGRAMENNPEKYSTGV